MTRLIPLIFAVSFAVGCASTEQAATDHALACSWSMLAIEHGTTETKLYAADYAEKRCDMPGMLREVEAAVCDIWKHDDGYTDAECEDALNEFRQIRAGVAE